MIKKIMLSAIFIAPVLNGFADEDYVKYVKPLIGTTEEGNTFPGSCMPFGLVQASPDSGDGRRMWCSGYKYEDTTIRGFSQTHLNGTGRPAMGDILLQPFCGKTDEIDFQSPYKKENQISSPDYYSVILDRWNIKVETTTSPRVAWYKFTYPKGSEKQLFVDAAAMLMQKYNIKLGQSIPESSYKISDDKTEIIGYRKGHGWLGYYKIFYSVKFDRAIKKIKRLKSNPYEGKGDRFIVDFDGDDVLNVQVAISTVSEEGAVKNRVVETKGQTFESVRKANRTAWNELLSRCTVEKGTLEEKQNWYTSLYHLFIQPNNIADVDGKYRASDDKVYLAKSGEYYSTLSLWDTFRAAHPLYTLLIPEKIDAFSQTMISAANECGTLPMWTMWGVESYCMVGIHSIPTIVDAWAKGFRGFDADDALEKMFNSMMLMDGKNLTLSWNAYWENGYIPYKPGAFDKHVPPGGTVSKTLELAYNWWCIARFAKMIGNERAYKDANHYAQFWKNLFDKKTCFMRPRAPKTAGGAFREPFSPFHEKSTQDPNVFWGDYTEATAWIYTWHVFQSPFELVELMGGKEKTLEKLDQFFTLPPVAPRIRSANNDVGGIVRPGQIGQYWHGNEPSHHIIYFYSLLGKPERAAELVRNVCSTAYLPSVDGLCGNDDCGQMSAWYLFSSMGFYPFNPCDDGYVFGAPQVEEIKLKLPNGKSLTIKAKNISKKNLYVKSISLNGKKIDSPRITHNEILEGGELVFEMCEKK